MYKSIVKVYRDTSYDTAQYGVHYIIGDDHNQEDIKKLNLICDNITFREHYRACVGRYPKGNQSISYGLPVTNEKEVLFYNTPLSIVKNVGDQIANILNVNCMCPYSI